ncbi:MAG: cytochrome c oxidase subunit II [Flavobacteriales bacterium]
MKLLIILVVILAIIAIVQLTKVYDLSRALRKTKEEDISPADNKLNANLMLLWMGVFFLATIILYIKYGDYLPEPASKHGVDVDWLMSFNMWAITIAFFIMNAMLFLTAWRFYYRKDRKAEFVVHNNFLEMIWTGVPGVFMAIVIVYGLITWKEITGPASPGALQIELFSRQFDWTARYAGQDKVFGASNFNLISGENALGLVTKDEIRKKISAIDAEIEASELSLKNDTTHLMPASQIEVIEDRIFRLQRHKQRILDLNEGLTGAGVSDWDSGADDNLVKGEMHLPLGQEVEFIFRSQDVIHSAYMPHFRAQMNTVPGMPTRFKMTPTITTKEMRQKLSNESFDYILLCNKVCGAAHFNMQMKVVVESPEDYAAWLATQKTFVAKAEPAKEVAEPVAKDTSATAMNTMAPIK